MYLLALSTAAFDGWLGLRFHHLCLHQHLGPSAHVYLLSAAPSVSVAKWPRQLMAVNLLLMQIPLQTACGYLSLLDGLYSLLHGRITLKERINQREKRPFRDTCMLVGAQSAWLVERLCWGASVS